MELEQTEPKNRTRVLAYTLGFFFGIAVLLVAIGAFALSQNQAPVNTEYPISFTIEPGSDAQTVGQLLFYSGVVKSDAFFNLVLTAFFDPTEIKASTYIVDEPLTTYQVAQKLIQGDFGNDLVRFTHIEGESVNKLADSAAMLPQVDRDIFIAEALPYEGQLFPDTYFIREDFTEEELVSLLRNSFDEAVAPLQSAIESSEYSLEQILILASIIEREANTPESMRLVSSVFQNRIDIGMPLQADASIEYILDKPLNELTAADLKIDSPYNTYVNPGLPPTPIGNPGLQAIEAVLFPTDSIYIFYITDDTGQFHFAETYSQHLRNIELYLR